MKNKPDGIISNSLESITGMEEFVESQDEAIKQIAKMILAKYPKEGVLSAAILAPIIAGIAGDNWNKIMDIEIDDYDDKGDRKYKDKDSKHHHQYTIKKIIKYKNNKCITQTGSIPLTGKIGAKIPILLGDFYPCEINGGHATLNVPNTADLQFVAMHLDTKKGNHVGIAIDMKKIKNLADNNALFEINFSDKMKGKYPITGKEKILGDINAVALYNKAKQTINFKSGNSLAISAILKS